MRSEIAERMCECDGRDGFAQLEAQIRSCLRHFVRNFRITICDDGLILHGLSRTYYGKQLVQHGVMARCQLPIRANNITVKASCKDCCDLCGQEVMAD